MLFIQESFQVLESDVYEVNKKIQLEDRPVSTVFFCTGYQKSSFGPKSGRDNFATISNYDCLDSARFAINRRP